jgi:hypothetical protein
VALGCLHLRPVRLGPTKPSGNRVKTRHCDLKKQALASSRPSRWWSPSTRPVTGGTNQSPATGRASPSSPGAAPRRRLCLCFACKPGKKSGPSPPTGSARSAPPGWSPLQPLVASVTTMRFPWASRWVQISWMVGSEALAFLCRRHRGVHISAIFLSS